MLRGRWSSPCRWPSSSSGSCIGFQQFVELSSPAANAMDVYVMGKQWMWKFAYPEGPNSIGVLHVPANRPVRLLITSRRRDPLLLRPGLPRQDRTRCPAATPRSGSTATKPGRYQILCAEYCGTQHSQDVGRGRGDGARGLRRAGSRSSSAAWSSATGRARPTTPGRSSRRETWPRGQAGGRRAGLPQLSHRRRRRRTSARPGSTSTSADEARRRRDDHRRRGLPHRVDDGAHARRSSPATSRVMPSYQGQAQRRRRPRPSSSTSSRLRIRPDRAGRPSKGPIYEPAEHRHAVPRQRAAFPAKHYLNDGTTRPVVARSPRPQADRRHVPGRR